MQSFLSVRRSIHIKAQPQLVWHEFESFERMNRWWGMLIGRPDTGTGNGQRLLIYEPRVGGRIEMQVILDGAATRYGGRIVAFEPGMELTFESDWFPNRGWQRPTFVTLRLTPALDGTLVELMHHGFEHTGENYADEHAAYEAGWGMTQLRALREIVAGRSP